MILFEIFIALAAWATGFLALLHFLGQLTTWTLTKEETTEEVVYFGRK